MSNSYLGELLWLLVLLLFLLTAKVVVEAELLDELVEGDCESAMFDTEKIILVMRNSVLKTSYFYCKGWKIQIFPDFWQLFLFLLSKVIQNDFPWLQDDWKMTCRQKNPVRITFGSKKRKSCQKSGKIWIFHPLK